LLSVTVTLNNGRQGRTLKNLKEHITRTTHPKLGKAGGTVAARRTLEGTISRI